MNNKIIKYVIPSLTLVGGIALTIFGLTLGAAKDYKAQLNITDIQSVVEAKGIAGLDVKTDYANVEIVASNDVTDFEVTATNISREFLNYSSANNVFSLNYPVNKWYESVTIPLMLKNKGTIRITVPADISLKDIQIQTDSGDSKIKYLTAENIYINSGSGATTVDTVAADYSEVTSGSGAFTATNYSAEHFLLNSGSGNVNFCNIDTDKAEFITGSGDVILSGIIEGNSVFSCGSGDVKATIFRDLSNYSVYTGEDEIMLNGKEFSGMTKGEKNMDITPGFGDVDIKFE